jgi:two-component system sensor histidine kinase DegS
LGNTNIKRINDIIKSTLTVIDQSRGAIFDIAEGARKEVANLKNELQHLKKEAHNIIDECEKLDVQVAKSRRRLSIINSEFDRFTEEDMREAYQEANEQMVELALARERERQMILQRNDVERRLKNAIDTVGKAEQLVAQVGTAFSYLSGDLQRMDEQIENSENKRMLAIRIIKAQETERRRIAREMHDGPAQAMSNVVLKAEICEKMSEIDMNKAIAELKNLKDVVRSCLTDVRRIIYDLRPMSIDDLGLKPTLQKYIETFQQENKIQIDMKFKGDDSLIKDNNIVLTIFRVVQECLNNTRKHAKASYISIQFEFTDNFVALRVKDDGKGFDTASLNELDRDEKGGFGVFGMKERVELLEGTFKIESSIGVGTTVKVQMPYNIQGVV